MGMGGGQHRAPKKSGTTYSRPRQTSAGGLEAQHIVQVLPRVLGHLVAQLTVVTETQTQTGHATCITGIGIARISCFDAD